MRYSRRAFNHRREFTFGSYVHVNDEEVPVLVYYEASPAEPDVNWPGGVEINKITYKGYDIQGMLDLLDWERCVLDAEEDINRRYQEYMEGYPGE